MLVLARSSDGSRAGVNWGNTDRHVNAMECNAMHAMHVDYT